MSSGSIRKGRVRTGCLTCRERKVKCDEKKPRCSNCTRLSRSCAYEHISFLENTWSTNIQEPTAIQSPALTSNSVMLTDTLQSRIGPSDASQPFPNNMDVGSLYMTGEWGDFFPIDSNILPFPGASPGSILTNDQTRIDEAFDKRPSFAYFTSHVEPPFITPWDLTNWTRMKAYITALASFNSALSAAVLAVESLYSAVSEDADNAEALSQYFLAKRLYITTLKDDEIHQDIVLVTTFLLCCFEVVAQQETVPSTLKQKDIFVSRLESWSTEQSWSPIARRIIAWLRIFHTKAMHLGGRGLLSPRILELIPDEQQGLPSLAYLLGEPITAVSVTIDSLQQSLFDLHCNFQRISTRSSALNRHHRSRGTLDDEMKVAAMAKSLDASLEDLWKSRPMIVDAESSDLQTTLKCSEEDLLQINLVAGLCKLSYCAEIIYLTRANGKEGMNSDKTSSIREAMRIVLGELSGQTIGLHPAFMWPLFTYAVEATRSEEISWVLGQLKRISDPLWHTDFIISMIEGLTTKQLQTGERVDSRYFCVDKFGIVPPFM